MAECKVCKKELSREASEIGSWCIDCIKEKSNIDYMEHLRNGFKKENLLIMIFAAIGAVGGIALFLTTSGYGGSSLEGWATAIFVGIWPFGGFGTGLGYFISAFAVVFKLRRERGESFEEALKSTFQGGLGFLVLGFVGGIIFFLVLVLRRKKWIKKLGAAIDSEVAVMDELDGYTLGKETNKANLSRKISIIFDNDELFNSAGSLPKKVKKLKIVE